MRTGTPLSLLLEIMYSACKQTSWFGLPHHHSVLQWLFQPSSTSESFLRDPSIWCSVTHNLAPPSVIRVCWGWMPWFRSLTALTMDKSTDALATVCSLHTPLLGSSVSYLVEDVCVYMFSFQYIFHMLIFLMRIIYHFTPCGIKIQCRWVQWLVCVWLYRMEYISRPVMLCNDLLFTGCLSARCRVSYIALLSVQPFLCNGCCSNSAFYFIYFLF